MFYKPELDFWIILLMAFKFLVESLTVYSSLVFQFHFLPSVGLLQNCLMCPNCPENTVLNKKSSLCWNEKTASILVDSRWLPCLRRDFRIFTRRNPQTLQNSAQFPLAGGLCGTDLGSSQGRHPQAACGCCWEGNPADISSVPVYGDVLLESLGASLGKAGCSAFVLSWTDSSF